MKKSMRNIVDPAEMSGLGFKSGTLSKQLKKGGMKIPPSWLHSDTLLSDHVTHQALATGLSPTGPKLPQQLDV